MQTNYTDNIGIRGYKTHINWQDESTRGVFVMNHYHFSIT